MKNIFSLVIFLLSINLSFARECDPYDFSLSSAKIGNLEELSEVTEAAECNYASSKERISLHFRKRFELSERKQINIKHSKNNFFSKKMIPLFSTEKELKALNLILTKDEIDTAIDRKSCFNVVCILTEHFGDQDVAMQAMIIANKSGYGVQKTDEKTSNWTAEELSRLSQTLNYLPVELEKLPQMRRFRKVPEKEKDADGSRVAGWTFLTKNSDIYIPEKTLSAGHSGQILDIIVHELAHQHDNENHDHSSMKFMSSSPEFKEFSGWKNVDKMITNEKGLPEVEINTEFKEGLCFITEYSKTNQYEYYAEMLTNYILHPVKLKTTCPKVYQFAKDKVFSGKEFSKHINTYSDEKLGKVIKECVTPNYVDFSFPKRKVELETGIVIDAMGGIVNTENQSCKELLSKMIPDNCRVDVGVRDREVRSLLTQAEDLLHKDIAKAFKEIKVGQVASSCKVACSTPQISPGLIKSMNKSTPGFHGLSNQKQRGLLNRMFLGTEFTNKKLFK